MPPADEEAPARGAHHFAGDAAWSVAANGIASALAMVFAATASRLLGAEGFGIFGLVAAATGSAYTILLYWLPPITIRFGRAEMVRRGHIGTTITVHSAIGAAGLVAAAAAGFAFEDRLEPFLGGPGTVRAACAYLAVFFLLDHSIALLQAGRAMRVASSLYVVDRAVALALVAGAAVAVDDRGVAAWPWILSAALGGRAAAGLIALPALRRLWRPPEDSALWRQEVRGWAPPLVVIGLATVLSRWGNLAILRRFGALADVGRLYAGTLVGTFVGVLMSAFCQVLFPFTVEAVATGRKERIGPYFDRLFPLTLFITSASIAAVGCAAPLFFPWIFGEAFRPAGRATGLLILGSTLAFGAVVWEILLTSIGTLWAKLGVYLAASVWSVVAGLALTPRWGLAGAAIATATGPLVQAILARRPALRRLGIRSPHDAWALAPPAVAASLLVLLPDARWALPLYLAAVAPVSAAFLAAAPPRRADLDLLVALTPWRRRGSAA